MGLEESLHTLMIRKNLRSAHTINKSYIVHHTSYMATAFSNAVALPNPLPELTGVGMMKYAEAERALGALDAMGEEVPSAAAYLYTCVRREAVLSSMIEGTQSTLNDFLLYEQRGSEASGDVEEVGRYVAAMQHGMARLEEGCPITLRLIRELHAELLKSGRGSGKQPGEFRQSQNWIGGARPGNAAYVPPPPQELMQCLGDLELFINRDDDAIPVLVKAAMVHVQFESIHPFLDGNGRVGRLLIQMMLCRRGVLHKPLLYLSLYFKRHREAYYRLLDSVRQMGAWEPWLEFFMEAVATTAKQAADELRLIGRAVREHHSWADGLGRVRENAKKVLDILEHCMICRPLDLAKKADLAPATVYKILDRMEEQGIVRQQTNTPRNRIYAYAPYAAMLNER